MQAPFVRSLPSPYRRASTDCSDCIARCEHFALFLVHEDDDDDERSGDDDSEQLGRGTLAMLGAHMVVTSTDGVMFAVAGRSR